MSKIKEFWEIENGVRCPHCKSTDVKNVTSREGMPYTECRHCKTRFTNYSFNWLNMGLTLATVIILEVLMIYVFLPLKMNRGLIIGLMIVLVIVLKEVLAFLVYLLFDKTKVNIIKEKTDRKEAK